MTEIKVYIVADLCHMLSESDVLVFANKEDSLKEYESRKAESLDNHSGEEKTPEESISETHRDIQTDNGEHYYSLSWDEHILK